MKTPLPWHVVQIKTTNSKDGSILSIGKAKTVKEYERKSIDQVVAGIWDTSEQAKQEARFICLAANTHKALTDCLRDTAERIKQFQTTHALLGDTLDDIESVLYEVKKLKDMHDKEVE